MKIFSASNAAAQPLRDNVSAPTTEDPKWAIQAPSKELTQPEALAQSKVSGRSKPQPPSAARKIKGDRGEAFAAQWLSARGYTIVARNWRPGAGNGRQLRGELDLVAWQAPQSEAPAVARRRGTLCFVEVKARSGAAAAPQEAVTPAKQRQISRLAAAFVALELPSLLRTGALAGTQELALDDVPCRLDVVEVWLHAGQPTRAVLHENAFDFREG